VVDLAFAWTSMMFFFVVFVFSIFSLVVFFFFLSVSVFVCLLLLSKTCVVCLRQQALSFFPFLSFSFLFFSPLVSTKREERREERKGLDHQKIKK